MTQASISNSKGKDRLAANGYYITYCGPLNQDLSQPRSFRVEYIKDGKANYIHDDDDGGWTTLLWTCAITKKKLASSQAKDPNGEFDMRYLYFATHEDLLKFPHISHKLGALKPSPLDI